MHLPTRETLSHSVLLAMACAAALVSGSCAAPEGGAPQGQWIQLFNGRNLDGWVAKISGEELGRDPLGTFRVEDGLLRVRYDRYQEFEGRFGHLFHEHPYSHYRLRVEYRFVGVQVPGGPGWAFRNNGVMIHSQDPQSMELDQDFPDSIEVQLLGGRGEGIRHTANLCTPGTHVVLDGKLVRRHCTDSTSKTYRGDRWVTVEVEVHGSRLIRHLIDGVSVLEYQQPQLDEQAAKKRGIPPGDGRLLKGGFIAIQAESHPTDFRRIELLPLGR